MTWLPLSRRAFSRGRVFLLKKRTERVGASLRSARSRQPSRRLGAREGARAHHERLAPRGDGAAAVDGAAARVHGDDVRVENRERRIDAGHRAARGRTEAIGNPRGVTQPTARAQGRVRRPRRGRYARASRTRRATRSRPRARPRRPRAPAATPRAFDIRERAKRRRTRENFLASSRSGLPDNDRRGAATQESLGLGHRTGRDGHRARTEKRVSFSSTRSKSRLRVVSFADK